MSVKLTWFHLTFQADFRKGHFNRRDKTLFLKVILFSKNGFLSFKHYLKFIFFSQEPSFDEVKRFYQIRGGDNWNYFND